MLAMINRYYAYLQDTFAAMSIPSKESVMTTSNTVSPQPTTPVASPTVNESVIPTLVDLVHVSNQK